MLAFWRSRLGEDEQAANKAAEPCGCHPPAPSWVFGDEETDGRILVAGDPHPGMKRRLGKRWSSSYDGLFAACHIVRHDPARVLRDVDAARKRLAALSDAIEAGRDSYDLASALLPYELLPYADHPDYKESWRP